MSKCAQEGLQNWKSEHETCGEPAGVHILLFMLIGAHCPGGGGARVHGTPALPAQDGQIGHLTRTGSTPELPAEIEQQSLQGSAGSSINSNSTQDHSKHDDTLLT